VGEAGRRQTAETASIKLGGPKTNGPKRMLQSWTTGNHTGVMVFVGVTVRKQTVQSASVRRCGRNQTEQSAGAGRRVTRLAKERGSVGPTVNGSNGGASRRLTNGDIGKHRFAAGYCASQRVAWRTIPGRVDRSG